MRFPCFSLSGNDDDYVRKACELGANGYLAKPASATPLTDMTKALRAYWLELNVS